MSPPYPVFSGYELLWNDRERRIKRAFDLSLKQKELPPEHQVEDPFEVRLTECSTANTANSSILVLHDGPLGARQTRARGEGDLEQLLDLTDNLCTNYRG